MKMTLLEMVRDIMSDGDADDIGSITDTEESEQVARIVRTTFYEMIEHRNWPHLSKFRQMGAVGDSEKPTHFMLPEDIKELQYFSYDVSLNPDVEEYRKMTWLDPEEFLRRSNQLLTSSASTTTVTDFEGARFKVHNDKMPQYYTSFDDRYIILDAYYSALNATLITDKTQSRMYISPSWQHVDEHVPDLPTEAFPGFLAECKSVYFITLKQVANEKEEQKSRRQASWMSRKAWQVNGGIKYPDYGRTRRKYRGPHFDKNSYKDRYDG